MNAGPPSAGRPAAGTASGTASGPASVVRLRRTRWTLTLLYTAVSAAALVALVFIATAIDARAASRALDSQVSGRALALSRAVWMDHGTLHLEPLSEDELANASTVTAVIRREGTGPVRVRWARPSAPSPLPPAGELHTLWTSTVREQGPVLATAAGADGRRLRWAAAPVWDTDTIGAVVLTAVELAPLERQHEELVRSLVAGCAVLVFVSAGAGHWLSGRSMRPALRALDQQERFLREAAHELRTPLAALRLALEGGVTSTPGATRAPADAVRLVDHLARLVAGLLSRARVQAGSVRVELTPLRLDQLVEQVVDELPYDEADVTVRTRPTVVLGDPDLLTQAVRNLVENALRHGAPADGPPLVDVHVAAGRISVRDNGPGIAAADREKVFGDRVTGGRDGRDGVGVGLAIVRWVADLHGGTARAIRAPGGGALVELALPPHTPS